MNTVFDAGIESAVHADHLEFIFEIRHGAQTAHDDRGPHIAGAIDQQVFEGMHHDLAAGLGDDGGTFRLDHGDPLFQGEQRAFVAIDGNTDDQPIHQRHRALDDIDMAKRDRVKGCPDKGRCAWGPLVP